jgi:hypothetical protein
MLNNSTKLEKTSTNKKQNNIISTNGILTFSFGFLGLSIVGLSSFLKDLSPDNFSLNQINFIHFSQLLIFLVFLFRYLLGNLSYLLKDVNPKTSVQIQFFLVWVFTLIQFLFIIPMGLTVKSDIFWWAFAFLICSELLWSLFNLKADKRLLENFSRILMLATGGLLSWIITKKADFIDFRLVLLYGVILLDCFNDLFKNKENYISILKS